MITFTDPRKFSPLKVSCYTVFTIYYASHHTMTPEWCIHALFNVHFLLDAPEDFTIDSKLRRFPFSVELFLGPTVSRSCFTINTINDTVSEIPQKEYQFSIPTFVEGPSFFQVSPTSFTRIAVTILDDECEWIVQSLISDTFWHAWEIIVLANLCRD